MIGKGNDMPVLNDENDKNGSNELDKFERLVRILFPPQIDDDLLITAGNADYELCPRESVFDDGTPKKISLATFVGIDEAKSLYGFSVPMDPDETSDSDLGASCVLNNGKNRIAIWLLDEELDLMGGGADKFVALSQAFDVPADPKLQMVPLDWDVKTGIKKRFSPDVLIEKAEAYWPVDKPELEEKSGEAPKGEEAEIDIDGVETPIGRPIDGFENAFQYGDGDTAFLEERQIEVAFGEKARQAWDWRTKSSTVKQLKEGLLTHKVGPKDGACFTQGALVSDQRSSKNVRANYILGLDIDTGEPIEYVRQRIIDAGLFAIIYTTHSHGGTDTSVKSDAIRKYFRPEAMPNIDGDIELKHVVQYLRDVKSYWPELLDTMEWVEEKHIEGGVHCIVSHAPMDKYRVVFLLKEPFEFANREGSQTDAILEWKQRYTGAGNLLNVAFDQATVDPARLFYNPRHPKGATNFRAELIHGEPLDIDNIERADFKKRPARKADNAFLADAGEAPSGGVAACENKWLFKWFGKNHKAFRAADFLEENYPDADELIAGSDPGKITLPCPNFDNHTDETQKKGFYAANYDLGGEDRGYQMSCRHTSCGEINDRLLWLDKIITYAEWSKEEFLELVEDYVDEFEGDELADGSATESTEEPPKGFYRKNGTIYYKKDDDDKPVSQDFKMLWQARDDHSEGWSMIIEFRNRDDEIVQHHILRSDLVNNSKSVQSNLADKGFDIEPGSAFSFERLLLKWNADKRVLFVPDPGFNKQRSVYACPDGSVIGDSDQPIFFQSIFDPQIAGTLEGQKSALDAALCSDVDIWGLAALAQGAGPLAQYLGEANHLVAFTGNSSTGKTTALRIAGSAFANPEPRVASGVITLRGTDNGLESTLQEHNGRTACLDETRLLSSRPGVLQQLIFMIAEGSSKKRADRNGDGRKTKHWSTFTLLTGERSITQEIAASGDSAANGVLARCIDIDNSAAPVVDDQTMAAVKAINDNYGHTGPEFVRHLLTIDPDTLRADLETIIADLTNLADGKALEGRAARPLALLQLSGQLMQECQLISTDIDLDALIDRVWLDGAQAEKMDPVQSAIETLQATIIQNRGGRICDSDMNEDENGKVRAPFQGHWAWIIHFDQPGIYIAADELLHMAGNTLTKSKLVKELEEKGFLIRRDEKNVAHSYVPGFGNIQCYKLALSFIGEPENVFVAAARTPAKTSTAIPRSD